MVVFLSPSHVHLWIYFLQDEYWEVEFEIGHDDNGKVKAVSVTAPGGGPCFGPRKARPNTRRRDGKEARTKTAVKGPAKPKEPFWHDSLSDTVKGLLEAKNIRKTTGTVDLSVGDARVKLGTNGYSSVAHASGLLAEGSFTCDADGNATFTWEHWIACNKASGVWAASGDNSGLPSAFNLGDGECLHSLFFTTQMLCKLNQPSMLTCLGASIRCFFFSVIDQRMSSLWKLTKLLKLYGATSLIPNQLWKKMASRCVTLFWHLGAGGRFLDCLLQLVSFSTTIMKTTPEDIIMSVAMLCSSLVNDGGRNHTNPFK